MVNRIILIGRLGRDPETRFTSGGVQVTNFSLAVDEQWKDKSGEKQKKTTWFKVTAWSKLAEIVQKYIVKGSLVFVEGRMGTQEWNDKEGNKRTDWIVTAETIRMLGGKKNGEAAEGAADHSQAGGEADDSDIPF